MRHHLTERVKKTMQGHSNVFEHLKDYGLVCYTAGDGLRS